MIYNFRLVVLTVTTCIGAVLFGYDTGFIGPATSMQSFRDDFGINDQNNSEISGNVVSTLQAGCFFGALLMSIFGQNYGRRQCIAFCGLVFNIGAAMQTAAKGKIGLLYAGRVVSGLGVGSCSLLVPMYLNEVAPKKIRGTVTMMYGVFLFSSICIAYWIDYVCHATLLGSNQWIVPVALQLVLGSLMVLGMIPLKESPRWLIRMGREDEALESLRYIREGTLTEEEISDEYNEILAGYELEVQQNADRNWKELFNSVNRYRSFLCVMLMLLQQCTGTNSFTYYSTIFFQFVGITGSNASLFATGVYGIVKMVVSLIWSLFFIDKVGRKRSLISGAIIQGTVMIIIAGIYKGKNLGSSSSSDEPISAASYVMIVMIFLFCVGYAHSWGPVPWTYVSEIYPTRVRDYGIAIGACSQWAFNFAFTKMIPYAISNLGWKVFLMFGILNYVALAFTLAFIKETSGKSLEEMEEVFDDPWRSVIHKKKQKKEAAGDNEADNDNTKNDDLGSIEKANFEQVEVAEIRK